jgi:hypothetical protein
MIKEIYEQPKRIAETLAVCLHDAIGRTTAFAAAILIKEIMSIISESDGRWKMNAWSITEMIWHG